MLTVEPSWRRARTEAEALIRVRVIPGENNGDINKAVLVETEMPSEVGRDLGHGERLCARVGLARCLFSKCLVK